MIDKFDDKNLNTDTEELNNICDECKEEDKGDWSCTAAVRYTLHAVGKETKSEEKYSGKKNVYNKNARSWGYANFMEWILILDPANGYTTENGEMTLQIDIDVENAIRQ